MGMLLSCVCWHSHREVLTSSRTKSAPIVIILTLLWVLSFLLIQEAETAHHGCKHSASAESQNHKILQVGSNAQCPLSPTAGSTQDHPKFKLYARENFSNASWSGAMPTAPEGKIGLPLPRTKKPLVGLWEYISFQRTIRMERRKMKGRTLSLVNAIKPTLDGSACFWA